MPDSTTLLDASVAGQIFSTMWGVLADNFAGVAILLGAIIGMKIFARLTNGAAKSGKVSV